MADGFSNFPLLEMRIVKLEENSWFHEEKLKSLEEHILAQQKRIDSLEKQLDTLASAFMRLRQETDAAISATGTGTAGSSSDAELPPHHIPSRW